MGYRVNISPAVKQEVAAAYRWYADRSSQAANAFQDEVLDAFDLIGRSPERFSLWDELIRRCVLKHYPYCVYYSLENGEINILAVGHNRRAAGYWRDA